MEDKLRLIDVGARGGIPSRWAPFYQRLDVVAFEPDTEECSRLNSQPHEYSIRYLPVALGAEDGEKATLYVCRSPGCSSLLRPNTEFCSDYPYGQAMQIVGTLDLELRRMDTVCAEFSPDVIKIDTQGTELDVLRGAGQLLDSALAVELEVEFVSQYVGQSLFADVDSFMRDHGFTLRGLRRTYWRTKATHTHAYGGQIIHGDALYIRPDQIDSPKGHIILAAYRQYDLLAHLGARDLIPKEPAWARMASGLLARWRPNRELRRLIDRLRPGNATDWHDPDFF